MAGRLPDPEGSRAILIGTSDYEHADWLFHLPMVRNNLSGLESALTDSRAGVFLPANCAVADSPDSPRSFMRRLTRVVDVAEDVLLIYYAGHGVLDRYGELHLTVRESDPDPYRLEGTAVPFTWLRGAIAGSGAKVRVLILDCCFSGNAIGTLSADAAVLQQIHVDGTYVLTSTEANKVATAHPQQRYTSFSGTLIDLLTTQSPTSNLTLAELDRSLRVELTRRNHPRHTSRSDNGAGDLVLRRGLLPSTATPPHTDEHLRTVLPHVVPTPSLAETVAPPIHAVPRALNTTTEFIGRADELARLDELLSQDHPCRLVTLTGEGGIGKTRLAAQHTQMHMVSHGHPIYWVDLGSSFAVQDVVNELCRSLELSSSTVVTPEDLAQVLRPRRVLIVMDNFESVADRAPLVQLILDNCPEIKILVTSRQRLRVSGEIHIVLPPLDHGHRTGAEAVRLFVSRGAMLTDVGAWGTSEFAAAHEVCDVLGGIPLAIELAASHLGHLAVHDIRDLILDPAIAEHLLQDKTGPPEEEQTLSRSFEFSFSQLSDAEARLAEDIGYFQGSASLEAITAVSGTDDRKLLLETIRSLVDRSLVRVDTMTRTTRYHMLSPVRQHVLRKLTSSGRLDGIRATHSRYFVTRAWQMKDKLIGPDQVTALDDIEADVWNYVEAHHWAVEHRDFDSAMRLVAGLSRLWFARNFLPTGEALVNSVVAVADPEHDEVWIDWTVTRALICWLRDRPAMAESLLADAWDRAVALQNSHHQANIAANRGLVAQNRQQLDVARQHYLDSIEIASSNHDRWNLAIATAGLAGTLHVAGDHQTSLAKYLDSLREFRLLGDTWSLGRILRRVLDLAVDMRDEKLVDATSREAHNINQVLRDPNAVAEIEWILARHERNSGNRQSALRRYLDSGRLFTQLGRISLGVRSLQASCEILAQVGQAQMAGRVFGVMHQLNRGLPPGAGGEHADHDFDHPEDRIAFDVGFDQGQRTPPLTALEELRTEMAP